ncbi:MAG: cytochrome c [Cytophagales bacterium]|nr:cytochrome c [Cytophagales bacterium]
MKAKSKLVYGFRISIGLLVLILVLLNGCVHDPFIDPTTLNEGEPNTPGCVTDGNVCFESSVLPIFISSCARSKCHDATSHKEGYTLNNYNNIVRKGISPGNASKSKLYKVLFESGEDRMPPDAPLTQAQKDSIAAWINQGAKNTVNCNCACNPDQFTFALTVKPIINNQCVGCHKPGSLGGNINLADYTSIKAQVTNGKLVGSITHATGFSPMPQGTKLSECEINQIKSWINAGALNN